MREVAKRLTNHSRAAWRETRATLKQAALMPLEIRERVPENDHASDVVVFVHGFFSTAGAFAPLSRRLERHEGVATALVAYPPTERLHQIATRLARLVERVREAERVHIVGHSLGGVVARYFVDVMGGHHHVAQTIALGSPFSGTWAAERLPFFVGRDLTRESQTLARLGTHAGRAVPHLAVVASHDYLVGPHSAAAYPGSEVVRMEGLGHNSLLFDRQVASLVAQRVLEFRARGTTSGTHLASRGSHVASCDAG